MIVLLEFWLLWAMWSFIRVLWFMVCPPNPPGELRHKWMIAGFDMWIGAYLDRPNKQAYWFPIPCLGLKWWRS